MGSSDKRRGRDLDPRRWAELGLIVLLRVVADRSLALHPSDESRSGRNASAIVRGGCEEVRRTNGVSLRDHIGHPTDGEDGSGFREEEISLTEVVADRQRERGVGKRRTGNGCVYWSDERAMREQTGLRWDS